MLLIADNTEETTLSLCLICIRAITRRGVYHQRVRQGNGGLPVSHLPYQWNHLPPSKQWSYWTTSYYYIKSPASGKLNPIVWSKIYVTLYPAWPLIYCSDISLRYAPCILYSINIVYSLRFRHYYNTIKCALLLKLHVGSFWMSRNSVGPGQY